MQPGIIYDAATGKPVLPDAAETLARALEAVATARMFPAASTGRLTSLEEAHALAAIATATALVDIRSEFYALSAALHSAGQADGGPESDDPDPDTDPVDTWYPNRGDRVVTIAAPGLLGTVQEIGESEGATYARVLFDDQGQGPVLGKVWLDQIEPVSDDRTPDEIEADKNAALNQPEEHADDGDDDWPEGAHEPNPVFAEALAEAKTKGKKGSKK